MPGCVLLWSSLFCNSRLLQYIAPLLEKGEERERERVLSHGNIQLANFFPPPLLLSRPGRRKEKEKLCSSSAYIRGKATNKLKERSEGCSWRGGRGEDAELFLVLFALDKEFFSGQFVVDYKALSQ